MKIFFKYLIALFLLISFTLPAQEPGDTRPLADNSTFKGRREIKREKRIKHPDKYAAKHNEKKAMKKRDYGKKIIIGKRNKRAKVKNKEKKSKVEESKSNG